MQKGSKHKKESLKKMKVVKKGKHFSPKTEFKKGQVAPMKGRKRPDMRGEKNHKWKGGISGKKGYSNIFKIRYKARKHEAEGSHTFGEWELLKKQYGYRCPCCGRKEPKIVLTEDHIIPLSRGGSDYIENIQPLCGSCNCKKNTKVIKYQLCN